MNTVILPVTKSAYVSEYYPFKNFAFSEALFTGRFQKEGDIYRSLLWFDLSVLFQIIPLEWCIKSACLKINIVRNEVPAYKPVKLRIYALSEFWEERKVNWKNQPGTENEAEAEEEIASFFIGDKYIDITSLVTAWYQKTKENYGIVIKGEESCNSLLALAGSGFAKAHQKPALIVNYTQSIST
ncbi:DNRLRE domain-containing protein [Thermosyntropha sp.]|uniref:DNRLRE domain-containing protein n=1 Tax=Thermosyntropha sp. TaxID=2740820 RepID=UPI0025FFDF4D|nr:DNRLRE domain-containing protein [Thermosyntropha sp.]MBO8159923.1 DNRLRE domain-containing protein [Thermosyntropha sp.]